MSEEFYRGPALSAQAQALPAASYNRSRRLLSKSAAGCVFVPIRSMQFLAVIDHEEIIFVDSQDKRWIVLSWQGFRPQDREGLQQPVTYKAVYYRPDAEVIMERLQREFALALDALECRREQPQGRAQVLPFPK